MGRNGAVAGLVNAIWRFAFQACPRTILEPIFHVSLPNRNMSNRYGIGLTFNSSGFIAAYRV